MALAGKRNASNGKIPKATPTMPSDPKRNRVDEVLAIPPPPPLNKMGGLDIDGNKAKVIVMGPLISRQSF